MNESNSNTMKERRDGKRRRSTEGKKGGRNEKERKREGVQARGETRDAGGARRRRRRKKERNGKDARWKKAERRDEEIRTRSGRGSEGDEGGCRCERATVRTRRVYLSCFYRLARTSGPGYADADDDDDDEDGDEKKTRNSVGEERTVGERGERHGRWRSRDRRRGAGKGNGARRGLTTPPTSPGGTVGPTGAAHARVVKPSR